MKSRLVVLVDGKPMPEADARELWKRFSEHMDQHRLDFAGFAHLAGFASVRTESRSGQAVLVVSTRRAGPRREPGPSDSGSR